MSYVERQQVGDFVANYPCLGFCPCGISTVPSAKTPHCVEPMRQRLPSIVHEARHALTAPPEWLGTCGRNFGFDVATLADGF